MKRAELTKDDKKTIDDSEALEDIMLNSRGYAIIKEWFSNQKNKIQSLKSMDLKLPAEDLKLQLAINKTKFEMIDSLEKFLISKIAEGKDLAMQLLDPGQEEDINGR